MLHTLFPTLPHGSLSFTCSHTPTDTVSPLGPDRVKLAHYPTHPHALRYGLSRQTTVYLASRTYRHCLTIRTGQREARSHQLHVAELSANTHYTWPLCPSCLKHFILIVRLPLTTMLLTGSPLSLILTLKLVSPEFFFLCLLWESYRDCFPVFSLFLSLCFPPASHVEGSSLATRTCVFF